MRPLDYLHLQLRLEGGEVMDGSRLRQVEIVPGEELPILVIAQLVNAGLVVYYGEGIPSDLQQALSVHVSEIEFPKIDPSIDVLKSRGVEVQIGHYKTYVFPSRPENHGDVLCLSRHDPPVRAFGFDGFTENVYAIKENGAVISACVSARENTSCGEAWVYTAPEYRGRGLAQKVVRAWAGSLMNAGKVAFYSHRIENSASANLAARLGLQPVFEEIAVSPKV